MFKTVEEKILEALCDTNASLISAINGLEKTVSIIGEYRLWRSIRGDLQSVQEDAELLSRKVADYIALIESEYRAETEFKIKPRTADSFAQDRSANDFPPASGQEASEIEGMAGGAIGSEDRNGR